MATLKTREIKDMDSEKLNKKLLELRTELARERAQAATRTKAENPKSIKMKRLAIARILTHMNKIPKTEEKAE
ncbi:MAG: 50S ribosomal protein L29 [Candidatus Diapherotrites archaeon]|nr:50S ribosomal protein L29 [Candidatus Diapherotrites archaeon]